MPIKDSDIQHISPALRPLAVPIADIAPDPANAMGHSEANLQSIAASLDRFGQRKPIVVNKRTGQTEAGAGALLAAQSLGWRYVAVSFEDDPPDVAEQYGVADNAVASDEWQAARLQDIVKRAKDAGQDVPGVSDDWLADVLARAGVNGNEDAGRDTEPEITEIEAEKYHKKWQAKHGDVWQLGEHKIACLSSLERENIKKVCDGVVPTFVFSDPPYGISIVAANVSVGGGEAYDIPFGGVKSRKGYVGGVADTKTKRGDTTSKSGVKKKRPNGLALLGEPSRLAAKSRMLLAPSEPVTSLKLGNIIPL